MAKTPTPRPPEEQCDPLWEIVVTRTTRVPKDNTAHWSKDRFMVVASTAAQALQKLGDHALHATAVYRAGSPMSYGCYKLGSMD